MRTFQAAWFNLPASCRHAKAYTRKLAMVPLKVGQNDNLYRWEHAFSGLKLRHFAG